VKEIADALKHNQHLEELYLGNDSLVSSYEDEMMCCMLAWLDENSISDLGAVVLAEALKHNQRLQIMNLGNVPTI
jgi:hypothetical protein